jgi:cytochrome c peroxidase
MRSLRCGIAALVVLSAAQAGEPDPKVELGRRLFMDPSVSRGGQFSCATCHDPERGFSDPRQFSVDETGQSRRHSQPILDLGASGPLHWDGEFGSIRELLTARLGTTTQALEVARLSRTRQFEESQTRGRNPDQTEFQKTMSRLTPPYYGPVTQGRSLPTPITLRLDEDDRYAPAFRAAFGSAKVTNDRIVEAVHAYCMTLRSGENDYDRFAAGELRAISAEQRRGFELFTGKAGCAACHTIDHGRFTDDAFHNTGVAFRSATMEFARSLKTDGGAGEMTFVAEDLGRFKTPSLRDVARRAPYMHDGSFATLEDVVAYYNQGGTANGRLASHVRPLSLTAAESRDLVAFLHALTGDERPGLGPVPSGPRRARIRVVDLKGRAVRGLTVEIHPAGDRLEGGRREPPQIAITDTEGFFSMQFPAWTHVRLEAKDLEMQYGWPIPDCVTSLTVMAAPLRTVALKVRPPKGAKLPEYLIAFARNSKEPKTYFDRMRVLPDKSAIFIGGAHSGTALVKVLGRDFEIDLAGGWADFLDLRPEPEPS